MSPWFFMRMAKIVRRPPSKKQMIMVAVVLVVAFTLFGIEKYFGWPEWLTVNHRGGRFGGGL